MIDPRTLKGFRDYPPELMIPREALIEAARNVYRSYGFAPIDTPALEYAEILLGKIDSDAEIQRQVYRFKDHGDRDVALRFDLTVPFARFAAQHIAKLGTPFKRYHFGSVWRGENTQAGRYREFMQCDFDTIGTSSNAADIETALVIHDLMVGLRIERFELRINNRLILNGLLEHWGLTGQSGPVLRALDKYGKLGREKVLGELTEKLNLTEPQAAKILLLAELTGSNDELLERMLVESESNATVAGGVHKLRELLEAAKVAGIPDGRLKIDLSICRGLDYYTGTIYETYLSDLPKIGSVCSGGRYDNLAGLFTKQSLPGVGASLGLDRLLAALEELKLLPKVATPAQVLIVQVAADRVGDYQRLGRMLRSAGIAAEVYSDAKKIGVQLQYAEAKGFRLALIAGPEEFASGMVKIKVLAERREWAVPEIEAITAIKTALEA